MHRRDWWKSVAIGLIVPVLGGCRDSNPPAAFYRNLGSDDVLLLPVASVTHDVTLAKGSADWVPFREMREDGAAAPSEDGGPAGSSNAEIETEIRELLKEYNELVVERDVDELMVYHIDSHQETVKSWYELQFSLMDKLAEGETVLTGALPDSQTRIEQAFARIKAALAGLSVSTLTVESEELVVGKLVGDGMAPMCRFVIVEDEWFIDLPNFPETFTQRKPALVRMMSMIDTAKQGIESGSVGAEQVLAQLEILAKASSTTGTDDGNAPSNAEPDDTSGDEPSGTDPD